MPNENERKKCNAERDKDKTPKDGGLILNKPMSLNRVGNTTAAEGWKLQITFFTDSSLRRKRFITRLTFLQKRTHFMCTKIEIYDLIDTSHPR
jgi:hypothetical protein